ncbi:MAG: adenylate/guanylate cyclase domain-containing protein [Pseudomonadota bacterium]
MKRKLTTIFCADAVGYGSLMQSDEVGTLTRLNSCRGLMAELFARSEGRQVNTWGDAVIAEFPSVVEAVRCAIDIQDALRTKNLDGGEGPPMRFRIGINLGDVMEENGDLYGDGVNVAARLQSMAEPGGIVVSGTVHSLVHKQVSVEFDFLGEQTVKSIDEPVPSYSIRMADRNAPPEEAEVDGGLDYAPATPAARLAAQADGLLGWLRAQPRRIRIFAGIIAGLATINLLFSGIATPWFLLPSAPFALLIWRHYRRSQTAPPAEDANEAP